MQIFHYKSPIYQLLMLGCALFNIYIQPEVYCMIMSFVFMLMYEILNHMNGQTIENNIKKYLYGIVFVLSYALKMNVGLIDAIGSTAFIILFCYYLAIFIIPLF